MSFFSQDTKKTTMTSKVPAEEKLLAWPDAYYNEREPVLRKEMLDLAIEKGLSPEEDRIRKELFEIRYPEFGKKQGEVTKDAYLVAWMTFRFLGNSQILPFAKRRNEREIRKEMKSMGFDRMEAYGKIGEDLLYLELRHLGLLYFNLCREDKQYGSYLLGMGRMSDGSVASKAATEAYTVAYQVPERLNLREDLRLWTRALGDAYRTVFPDSGDLDARIAQDYETDSSAKR